MEKEKKQKYNMWQNSFYMIKLAFKRCRSVLLLCLCAVILYIMKSLTELYIAPVILSKVEAHSSIEELILTIILFAFMLIAISALRGYISPNTMFGRVELREHIISLINMKISTTSYPNTENIDVLKKLDKANKAVSGNSEATEAIWNTLTGLLQNAIGFIIYLLLLSSLDVMLAVIAIITSVAGYFLSKRINEWGYNHRDEEAGYTKPITYINRKSEDSLLAKDIRVFGMRAWLDEVYNKSMEAFKAFADRRESVYIWANIINALLAFIRNAAAYYYLFTLTLSNGMSASQFLLYFTAIGGFTTWITGILTNFSMLHQQSLDISLVREFLEIDEPFLFEGGKPIQKQDEYVIELKNVKFKYPEADKFTINGLNLKIKTGEKLAVVGLNGAGKTTLVKLICGFYDPTEGEVLLNGVDIREFDRREYYKLFSAVFQQFSVLEATVAQNVASKSDDIDYDRVRECVKKAGLEDAIESLPNKYSQYVGRRVFEDGTEFSGGQMQRLMLARALYKNADIIVLDEPTAALDPIAENEIYLSYDEMTNGKISVYISHRLASTRFCDRIILLDNGVIKEEGTHDELMERGGEYANLFEVQSKYYKEGANDEQ